VGVCVGVGVIVGVGVGVLVGLGVGVGVSVGVGVGVLVGVLVGVGVGVGVHGAFTITGKLSTSDGSSSAKEALRYRCKLYIFSKHLLITESVMISFWPI